MPYANSDWTWDVFFLCPTEFVIRETEEWDGDPPPDPLANSILQHAGIDDSTHVARPAPAASNTTIVAADDVGFLSGPHYSIVHNNATSMFDAAANGALICGGTGADAISDASSHGNLLFLYGSTTDAITSTAPVISTGNVELDSSTFGAAGIITLLRDETMPYDPWAPAAATATSPSPAISTSTPSPNDIVVLAGSTTTITDTRGNKWTIAAAGLIATNGAVHVVTANAAGLADVNGTIWQKNSSDPCWAPTAGTVANDSVVLVGSTAVIADASCNKWTDVVPANVIELADVNGFLWWKGGNTDTNANPNGILVIGTSNAGLVGCAFDASSPTLTPTPIRAARNAAPGLGGGRDKTIVAVNAGQNWIDYSEQPRSRTLVGDCNFATKAITVTDRGGAIVCSPGGGSFADCPTPLFPRCLLTPIVGSALAGSGAERWASLN